MTFRYIGSKSRLVHDLKAYIGPPTGGFFVDAFCGTGVVAEAAADLGWPVRINDNLASATISAAARLASIRQVPFRRLGGYEAALRTLNAAPRQKGFIWRTYSPASADECGIERRYFTADNAGRIDSMRSMIRSWRESGAITTIEQCVLVADLLSALNRVANIAGTFGCFLAKWTPQSEGSIELRPRSLKAKAAVVEVTTGDVFNVRAGPSDLVYLDPPYTKRQYASYYHILETVALGDEPIVEGVAGLRPWKDRASDFCYKVRALGALTRLVDGLEAERILLSYSSEGHIEIKALKAELSRLGRSTMHPLGTVGRYRPNRVASGAGREVTEFLAVVERTTARTPMAAFA